MKNLVLISSLFVAFTTFAAPSANAKVVAQVIDNRIGVISLTDDGKIKVKADKKIILSKQLTEFTSNTLLNLALTASNSEIETRHSDIVCMMMVAWERVTAI